MTDAITEYWAKFLAANPGLPAETPYQAWHFGDHRELADELAALVLAGKKTATASLYWEYEAGQETLPKAGDYSLITDFDGRPQCIIQTTEVRILPFNKVGPEFAADEGEGDLSLDYWRQGHWKYFSRTCNALGRLPDPEMPVVCERFRKVYP